MQTGTKDEVGPFPVGKYKTFKMFKAQIGDTVNRHSVKQQNRLVIEVFKAGQTLTHGEKGNITRFLWKN